MEHFIKQVQGALQTNQVIDVGFGDANPQWADVWAMQKTITNGIKQPKLGYKIGVHGTHGAIWAPIFTHESYPPAGVMGYECEIALKLGGDMTRGQTQVPAGSQFLVGIEILACPLVGKTKDFKAFLASGMGQYSYLVGDKVDYKENLSRADNNITIWENGVEIFNNKHEHPDGDPMGVLWRFLQNPPENFTAFRTGDIVTLGSISGLKPISPNMIIRAHIQDIGGIEIKL